MTIGVQLAPRGRIQPWHLPPAPQPGAVRPSWQDALGAQHPGTGDRLHGGGGRPGGTDRGGFAVVSRIVGTVPVVPRVRARRLTPSLHAVATIAAMAVLAGAAVGIRGPLGAAPVRAAGAALPAASPAVPSQPSPSATPVGGRAAGGIGVGDVVDLRTETSQTFANADGTLTTEFFSESVFYAPEGSDTFVPIAVGFASTTADGLDAVSARAPAAVAIADSKAPGGFLSVTSRGQRISFGLPADQLAKATAVTPTFKGAVADWASILPGVDLRVVAQARGSKGFFIWDAPPAEPAVRYTVDAPGLTPAPRDDGSIALLDRAGTVVAKIPHPYAVDSTPDALAGGGRYTDAVWQSLDDDGRTVTVRVDPAWLARAVYPVHVDPTVTFNTTLNTFDAHVASGYPGSNFGGYLRPDAPYCYEMWLGTDPSGISGESRDYIRWDLSPIAGATVDSAFVRMYPYHQYYNAPTVVRTWIGAVDSSWTEGGITWTGKPAAGSNLTFIDTVEGSLGTSSASSSFNSEVQGWVTSPATNFGIREWQNGNGATYWKRQHASEQVGANRPALVVTHHTPSAPSTPDLAPGSDSGASPTDGLTSVTSGLVFTGTADAGDTVTLYDGASAVGTGTATGGSWTITVAGPLGEGVHSFTARAHDTGPKGPASGVLAVTIDTTSPAGAIAFPDAGLPIAGDVAVTGTASDAVSFRDYTLDCGTGTAPSSWSVITTSTAAVPATGTLGTWSTGALAPGAYTLRLTVRDTAGNSAPAVTRLVYLDNTRRGDESYLTRVPFDLGGGWGLDVGVANGEARLSRSLFSIPSYGPPAGLDLAYSSTDLAAAGSLGYGWSSSLTQYLGFEWGFAVWHRADGGRVPFGNVGGSWTPLAGHFETLTAGTGGDAGRYIVTLRDQARLVFEGSGAGRLLRIENRFGKALTIAWGSGTATLTDASSRATTLTFTGSLITSVLDSAGRTWSFGYTGSDLTSITEPDPDGAGSLAAPVTALAYDAGHRLTTVTRTRRTAAGGTDTPVWTVGYDTAGRAASVIDPIAHASYGDVASTFTYSTGSTVAGLFRTYSPVARNSTTYEYDVLGRTTSITDPLTQTTTLAWTADSTLASVDDPNAVRTAYTYTLDGRGNLLTETADALGSPTTTRYAYNTSNDVTETHVADGTAAEVVATQAYDTTGTGGTFGHLVTVTANATDPDPAKRQVTSLAYTANDQVAAERDPKLVVTTHAYDPSGNEIQTTANCVDTSPPPNWWACTGSATATASVNVITTSVLTLGSTPGKLGLPDSTTSGLTGRTTSFAYDTLGRTTAETPPEGVTTHEYDELGNEIRTAQPGSLVTTCTLDLAGHVTSEAAPLRTTTTAYDATGAAVSTTVAGDTVSRTYDATGQLLAETVDPGSSPHLNLTTEHAYDASGREIATRDPAGTVRRTVYDDQGRVTDVIENCTIIDTTIPGDPAWRTCAGTGTHDATFNLTTTTTYDARGNTLSETAPNGRLTTFTYDDLDRLTRRIDNDVATPTLPTQDVTTEYAYDGVGNQTAVRSPTNTGGITITRTLYDNLGRVVQTIGGCTDTTPPANWWACAGTATPNASTNVITSVTYDSDGRRLSLTAPDPSATTGTSTATVTTRFAYNAAGRLCRVLENASVDLQSLAIPCETGVTGSTTSNVSTMYAYDAAGNLATMIDGNGHTTAYGHDARGRMTSLTDGTGGVLAWAYDDAAHTRTQTNRTDATPATPTITWTSDAAGRVISRAYLDDAGAARTTTYTYSNTGAVATAADGTSAISVTSDRLGRPTSVGVTGDPAAATTYGYSFTAPTRTDASGAYAMAVDPYGRITSLTDPVHASPFTFAYGADGQAATAAAPNANSTAFTYDPLGRLLTKVTGTRASYTATFNGAGNRLTEASTITGDPGNGTATTGYDPLGRLVSYDLPGIRTLGATFDAVPNRTGLATDGVPSVQTYSAANRPTGAYTYDADGRMTARPGSTGGSLEWDSLGRLVRVRVTPGGTIVAAYTYDALDRLLTVTRPGQATIRFRYAGTTTAPAQVIDDTTGTVIRNVTVGPEGTVLLDWLGTDRRLYGTNGHHDTTWTADDTGAVTTTLRYDPWGSVLRSSGTLPDWRFQGSWADTSTSLAWSVARWYDPVQGAFISEDAMLGDPANPGSLQLYAYGAGDPVGSWDPSGMWPWDALLNAYYQPNELEKTRCLQNPFECLVWIDVSAYAFSVGPGNGGRGDAIRHCVWQCLLARELSPARARAWATIHEGERFLEGRQGAREALYTGMDLMNNVVGRSLAAAVPTRWRFLPRAGRVPYIARSDALTLCRRAVRDGDLWIIKGGQLVSSGE